MAKKIELNPGHWHEATDRTHCVIEILNNILLEHPAIAQYPEVRRLIQNAESKLGEAYQLLGAQM